MNIKKSDLERSGLRPKRAPARGSASSPEGGSGYTQLLASQGQHEKEVVPTSVSPSIRRTIVGNQSHFTQKKTGWASDMCNTVSANFCSRCSYFQYFLKMRGPNPFDR